MTLIVPWLDEPWASAGAPACKALLTPAITDAADPHARATAPPCTDLDPLRPPRDVCTRQAQASAPSAAPTTHDTAVPVQRNPANLPHSPTPPDSDSLLMRTAPFVRPSTPTATPPPPTPPAPPPPPQTLPSMRTPLTFTSTSYSTHPLAWRRASPHALSRSRASRNATPPPAPTRFSHASGRHRHFRIRAQSRKRNTRGR